MKYFSGISSQKQEPMKIKRSRMKWLWIVFSSILLISAQLLAKESRQVVSLLNITDVYGEISISAVTPKVASKQKRVASKQTIFVTTQPTISGTLSAMPNRPIKLEGFNGYDPYTITETTTDDEGNFTLSYDEDYFGMGIMTSGDDTKFIVVLSGEEIRLEGETLAFTESIRITEGQENMWFETFATEHPRREQSLSAWVYLEKIYEADSLFAIHETPKNAIQQEMKRIKTEDQDYIDALPEDSYVHWFLPVRRLVSSVSTIAQYRTDEIPEAFAFFRDIDYASDKLYRSGLLKDTIEGHFWLIENSGRSLDSVYVEMGISIDRMLDTLVKDSDRFHELSDKLFDLLERRSLFTAAEHLANRVLEEDRLEVRPMFQRKMETYRAVKKGQTAPNILFQNRLFIPEKGASSTSGAPSMAVLPESMDDLQGEFTVLYFGSASCGTCTSELASINQNYDKWREEGVNVLYVSLDQDEQAFRRTMGRYSFNAIGDGLMWESPIVKDFHVYEMPTRLLLDSNREILLRLKSVKQMETWVDWYLVQGNLQR